jgi:hypothetical protein
MAIGDEQKTFRCFMTLETKITIYAFGVVNLLAHKTAPCGLFALLAHKTAPCGLFALLAHKTAPCGLFALVFTQSKNIYSSQAKLEKILHLSIKSSRGVRV